MSRSLLVVAGEPSGDMHLARLVAHLRDGAPDLALWGIAGDACEAEGVEVLTHTREMAVMGLGEVLQRYGFFRRVFREVLAEAERRRPEAALLVDYPGFNLRLAPKLKALGIKVLYYICPQVWAWNRRRIPRMARDVDRLMAIFPFEPAVFAGTGLPVDFVGHPLVTRTANAVEDPPAPLPGEGGVPIGLLPGSRGQEVARIFPALWRAAGLVEKELPEATFYVAAAGPETARQIEDLSRTTPGGPTRRHLVAGRTRDVLRQVRAAWVTSGTATLETALLGCPMVVVYKTSGLTYRAGRALVKIPHIGMVNLVAGREICPERIQREASPSRLAADILPLAGDSPERDRMKEGLRQVAEALGEPGAAKRAARIVMEELGEGRASPPRDA